MFSIYDVSIIYVDVTNVPKKPSATHAPPRSRKMSDILFVIRENSSLIEGVPFCFSSNRGVSDYLRKIITSYNTDAEQISSSKDLDTLRGRAVRKPVNSNPGLKVHGRIYFSWT